MGHCLSVSYLMYLFPSWEKILLFYKALNVKVASKSQLDINTQSNPSSKVCFTEEQSVLTDQATTIKPVSGENDVIPVPVTTGGPMAAEAWSTRITLYRFRTWLSNNLVC